VAVVATVAHVVASDVAPVVVVIVEALLQPYAMVHQRHSLVPGYLGTQTEVIDWICRRVVYCTMAAVVRYPILGI
jgi:hypothetical protein